MVGSIAHIGRLAREIEAGTAVHAAESVAEENAELSGGSVVERGNPECFGVSRCGAIEEWGAFAKRAFDRHPAKVAEKPADDEDRDGCDEAMGHLFRLCSDHDDAKRDDGEHGKVAN